MSILLSAYFPEGIVFAADKNATITIKGGTRNKKFVEPGFTKVLSWPYKRAVIGFVGLGSLAGLSMDEWLRIFIAGNREFKDINDVANKLRDQIESDFNKDFSQSCDLSNAQLVIHLGGFREVERTFVPVMYHIWNHDDIDHKTGEYPPGKLKFKISDDIKRDFKDYDYPLGVRAILQKLVSEKKFHWYNNGFNVGAFNVFKEYLRGALQTIQDSGFAKRFSGLEAKTAYCKMAIEVFGSYFTHHCIPEDRPVGGGVDVVKIPWPD